MLNQKLILIGLAISLLLALLALYFGMTGAEKVGLALQKSVEEITANMEKMSRAIGPIYTGDPSGFVVKFENGTKVYIAGDTGESAEMKIINDFHKPDIAILTMGDIAAMDYRGAAYAASLMPSVKYFIPYHYASFPILAPLGDREKFAAELEKYGLGHKFARLDIGQTKEILGVKITWLGHGAVYFESPGGSKILVDPEVTFNPSYPDEWKDLTKFGKIDAILYTHGHFDHLTIPDMEQWVKLYNPVLFMPYEASVYVSRYVQGKYPIMNIGGSYDKEELASRFGIQAEGLEGIEIYMVPAAHSSSAIPYGTTPW